MNRNIINVLLVEDNPGDARLMREMLAEANNRFNLEYAQWLSAGLARVIADDIDVILLDLSLPDSQGFNTFVKMHTQAPNIPILVLTGLDDADMAVKAVHEGAQDYLVKGGVDSQTLVRAIRYAIERQQMLVELEQRVDERTRELAEANERLKELDLLKSKFVSDVSHELRSPITNLSLYLELLEHARPEKQIRYLTILKNQTKRLIQLVEDILNLSRLDAGKDALVFSPVDLNAITRQVAVAHRLRAQAAGLTLSFEPAPNLPPILGDPNQLTQVVTNLIDNAINYTPQGTINISTQLDGETGQVCLVVRDSGSGISPPDLPHIFERFYRGQYASDHSIPGTGLGLAIVKEIVDFHHGTVTVASVETEGTTLKVWLPLAEQP
jgi:signal transduction histidine kinase